MSYKTEFPNYDGEFKIPAGFEDSSWHNDVMPSCEKDMEYNGIPVTIKIWQDYEKPENREYPDGKRYVFQVIRDEDDIVYEKLTDLWNDVESALRNIDSILGKFVNENNGRIQQIVNKILEGADVRKVLCEDVMKSQKLDSAFNNWWDTVKDDFMSGGEEFFGFDPYDEKADWGVDFLADGSVVFYGDIGGVMLELDDFKDMLKDAGIHVGTDVNVTKDHYTGGFKVTFEKITPEEFIKKVH